ncbi:MAG: hypothetical protein HY534_07340 [Chloroflexi bacterium]|nr:hypothetical protein [Chloroflexota bacterium]
MGIHAVNQRDVEAEKTNRGYTKFLHMQAGDPQIMIRIWGTESGHGVNSHPFNQMFYVLEGEIEMGDAIYTSGTCIFMPKDTDYGPIKVPKAAKILRYAEHDTSRDA